MALILELVFGWLRRRPRQVYIGLLSNDEIDQRLRRRR